jgi:hypothetical protein
MLFPQRLVLRRFERQGLEARSAEERGALSSTLITALAPTTHVAMTVIVSGAVYVVQFSH